MRRCLQGFLKALLALEVSAASSKSEQRFNVLLHENPAPAAQGHEVGWKMIPSSRAGTEVHLQSHALSLSLSAEDIEYNPRTFTFPSL